MKTVLLFARDEGSVRAQNTAGELTERPSALRRLQRLADRAAVDTQHGGAAAAPAYGNQRLRRTVTAVEAELSLTVEVQNVLGLAKALSSGDEMSLV